MGSGTSPSVVTVQSDNGVAQPQKQARYLASRPGFSYTPVLAHYNVSLYATLRFASSKQRHPIRITFPPAFHSSRHHMHPVGSMTLIPKLMLIMRQLLRLPPSTLQPIRTRRNHPLPSAGEVGVFLPAPVFPRTLSNNRANALPSITRDRRSPLAPSADL